MSSTTSLSKGEDLYSSAASMCTKPLKQSVGTYPTLIVPFLMPPRCAATARPRREMMMTSHIVCEGELRVVGDAVLMSRTVNGRRSFIDQVGG